MQTVGKIYTFAASSFVVCPLMMGWTGSTAMMKMRSPECRVLFHFDLPWRTYLRFGNHSQVDLKKGETPPEMPVPAVL